MAVTLPTLTETFDDEFTKTWYEIRADVIDNVLEATPVWVALMEMGAFTPQVGGRFITRTIGYGNQRGVNVDATDLLPMGTPKLDTMARWTWRRAASHVQYDLFEVQENQGKSQIDDFVDRRLGDVRDGMVQDLEDSVMAAGITDESGKAMQSLYDILIDSASRTTGTYGQINRPSAYVDRGNGVFEPDSTGTNSFWGPKYLKWNAPKDINLLDDMRTMYNTVFDQQEAPNLILLDQDDFELYEDFVENKVQIIKDEKSRVADLGFDVLRFKGKMLMWTKDMVTAGDGMMLNVNHIEVVYDPTLWFEMDVWKPVDRQPARITHIFNAKNLISGQLRRHGRMSDA